MESCMILQHSLYHPPPQTLKSYSTPFTFFFMRVLVSCSFAVFKHLSSLHSHTALMVVFLACILIYITHISSRN
ncbi:hypothetical protein K474DRAFT_1385201 [Panus rudis PR-1116 ss-1]|nr:hypothetical protein K474DRAFT_1385201 [Panus rudis PR-1116 ss-1]